MASPFMKPIRWLLSDVNEKRSAVTGPDVWGQWWDEAPTRTSSGVLISQHTALKVGAVYAAVRLISDAISSLPVHVYRNVNGTRQEVPMPQWLSNPDPDGGTWQQFLSTWLISKLVAHGACVRVLRNSADSPIGLKVLDPATVRRLRDDRGKVFFQTSFGRVESSEMIYDTEMIRPGCLMGTSKVDEARETLGLAKALEDFSARFFGNGSITSGIITSEQSADKDAAKQIKDSWEAAHKGLKKSNEIGVLMGGAKFEKTGVDPDEAQMLESRMFAVEEVARLFRITPTKLQSQRPGTQARASREQDAQDLVTDCYLPYIVAVESWINWLLPRGEFVKISVDGLLRAALADRASAYSTLTQAGVMTDNEARALEDLPPLDGGDDLRVPLAQIAAKDTDAIVLERKSIAAQRFVYAGWQPSAVLEMLELPPMEHTGLPSVQLQATEPGQADPKVA